jgi:hypothetical protein
METGRVVEDVSYKLRVAARPTASWCEVVALLLPGNGARMR